MTDRSALAKLQPVDGAPAGAWAARISACWRASVEAILEVGRLLTGAKTALPHGEFGAMIATDLPFGARTAEMLMAIAADPRITNPKHVSLLPSHWGTLYELTKLTDDQFEKEVEAGTICPELERKRAIKAARAIAPGRAEPSDSLDFFPTPPFATRALMQHVLPAVGFAGKRFASVWEPACGEGHIAEVLTEYADLVIATDVFDYGYGQAPLDFLGELPPQLHADWIITNPPFGDKTEQFVLRAFDLASVGVAMFVRLQWLETVGRYERIFRQHPPTLISFFCERVPLCKGEWNPTGATLTAYIWLVWVKDAAPLPPFWIPPGCRMELTQSDDAVRFTTHPVSKRPTDATGTVLAHDDDGVVAEPLPAPSPEPNDHQASAKSEFEEVPHVLKRNADNTIAGTAK